MKRTRLAFFPLNAIVLTLILLAMGLNSGTTVVAATTPLYGLDWPGNGAVRRMLYWHNPFPIYDATDVFKVIPRKKTTGPLVTTRRFSGAMTADSTGKAAAR